MIEILEMSKIEVEDALSRIGFGHFACAWEGQPYVVPINYAYASPYIFVYTTAGLKTEIIKHNPLICLQVEEFLPDGQWRSVVVTGKAEQVIDPAAREKAVETVRSSNPTLLPAIAKKWTKNWVRENVEVVYKVNILTMSGLASSEVQIAAASVRPAAAIQ
jgi:nitroimidazol reductase NimA-like FMN-containing flavoprotein (pyridoxamine 5'-phosphate oxidase superfamily)